ncbi:MAG: hypothetical protein EAZ95_15750 [Bacteroidetes bacterium]|nr:MAG: hypothetical protein EAZ95_15750 [Bacteroidota bacterium]
MKKILTLLLCLAFAGGAIAQKKGGVNVKVNADVKGCWVALIPIDDIVGKEYGWWSVWHEIKKAKKYKTAPATFTGVAKGRYVIVVYNPASASFDPNNGNPDQAADGVVLEEADIQKNASYNIKKAEFKTWYCLSCPWLYIWNGTEFVKNAEVIQDIVGKAQETTTRTTLSPAVVVGKTLKIQIREEKDEISYLNRVALRVGEQTILPTQCPQALQIKDAQYHTLRKGDMIELEFTLSELPSLPIVLETTGYYEPEPKFLSDIYQKYLRTR